MNKYQQAIVLDWARKCGDEVAAMRGEEAEFWRGYHLGYALAYMNVNGAEDYERENFRNIYAARCKGVSA